jgi:triosephosphate isomerase (TIM)
MTTKPKMIVGNWKMNCTLNQANELFQEIENKTQLLETNRVEIVLATPFVYLQHLISTRINPKVQLAAQNCSEHNQGAYTGEVSAQMLASIDCAFCIVGHSERRMYFKESNAQLLEKVKQLLSSGIEIIFCVGETLEEREANNHFKVVEQQLSETLFTLSEEEILQCNIAYEPVWAIGTGKTALPEQAQEMHALIRNLLSAKYNDSTATAIHILYGGSFNQSNAQTLLACEDIDGALIGGASLKATEFCNIIDFAAAE